MTDPFKKRIQSRKISRLAFNQILQTFAWYWGKKYLCDRFLRCSFFYFHI